MRQWIIVLFVCIPGLFLKTYSQQISFTRYSIYDGLVANPVRTIYQDKTGYIWVGTIEGLSRYDGYKFTNYTTSNGLSHNYINSIYEVNNKLLVAENNGGLNIFENNTVKKQLKANSAINAITPVNERLLLSTDQHGFYQYAKDSLTLPHQQKMGQPLGNIISLNDSLFLVASLDNAFIIFRKQNLGIVYQSHLVDFHTYALYKDSKDRIFACTSKGLRNLEIKKDNSIMISPALPAGFDAHGLTTDQVSSIIEAKDKSYWIGTYNGLVHVSADGTNSIYQTREGLPSNIIYCLYQDKENNIWIGTSSGLAKVVTTNQILLYNTAQGEYKNDLENIFSIDSTKLLLQTVHGLQYFDVNSNEFKDIHLNSKYKYLPVEGNTPYQVFYDGQEIGRINKSVVEPMLNFGQKINGISVLQQHPQGFFTIGTFYYLYIYKAKKIYKILPYRITAITIDKTGQIWAGTWANGLYKIRILNDAVGSIEIVNLSTLVKDRMIRGLYADSKHNIWVGTRNEGVFRLKARTGGKFETQHFNRLAGLISDWVNCFSETKDGDIWVGTFVGIDKLVQKPGGYRIFNFSNTINFFAQIKKILPLSNNRWICYSNTGFAIFKDENLQKQPALKPLITSAILGGADHQLTKNTNIKLKPDQNSARFEFSSLSFINEKQILYSYRLLGSNNTIWSKPENIHEASFASLSPGHYRFEVKALGWDGSLSSPATFSFIIQTPFYKQWWFIVLCSMLAAALGYALYRYRIKQFMKVQQVRNVIAKDLHDEIGSALTNISILAELSRNKNRNKEFSENLPGRIAEESTLAQQALDDIIWSINSNNDNLSQAAARMRRYAAEVFEPVGIDCIINFETLAENIPLNMEQRKDIYLVFKECLNNIIKHASATKVYIKITLMQNLLHIIIKDDGKGFDTNKYTDRNGLQNMRSRISKWNGKLDINSTEKGTTLDCQVLLASPK